MKLLTCASYYGTGSSAVTDLLNECDNVHDMGDYEFRFVQDPDGVCDLEYHLVLNNHRHNSGYALKRYERNVRFLNGNRLIKKYNRFFGNQWSELSKQYVKDLADLEYKGYWHQDLRDKGFAAYFIERSVQKIAHSVLRVNRDKNVFTVMKGNTNYAAYPGPKFYEITKSYIDRLFEYANSDHKEFVMADQLVPASNTTRYLKFFNDLKVVCVDRDPRDLYLLEKTVWHGSIIPVTTPRDFCIWYRATRAHKAEEIDDPDRILRIQFEDIIYHYEETADKILQFCGIPKVHHTAPRTKLDPAKSILNTRLFEKNPRYANEISVIENELSDCLYRFPDTP